MKCLEVYHITAHNTLLLLHSELTNGVGTWSSVFYCYLSSCKKGLKNSGLNRDSNPDLCDASAVLYQLRYQAIWEQVIMWVHYKPIDVELDDDNTRIFHVHIFLKFSGLFCCCKAAIKLSYNDQIHSFLSAVQIHGKFLYYHHPCRDFLVRKTWPIH